MSRFLKAGGVLLVLGVLAGCSVPRGAAIQSEILEDQNQPNPTFQLIEVTREVTSTIATWPSTGEQIRYNWLVSDRGPENSVMQIGDTVSVVVWDNEDDSLLSGDTGRLTEIPSQNVSAGGEIFLPYIGEVSVRGMTSSGLREKLQNRYETILPSAQVQVAFEKGRKNSVEVVGGVANPGRYPLDSRNTNILSIIALSGGINESLRNPLLRLQRGSQIYETRAEKLLEDPRRNIRLFGGDQLIVVEDERSFSAIGATGRQDVVYFEKDDMNVMEALAAVRGLNPGRADIGGLLLLREYEPNDLKPGLAGPNQQQVVFAFDLASADGLFAARQFEVQPDDTLYATESPLNRVQTIVGLFGTVIGVSSQVDGIAE